MVAIAKNAHIFFFKMGDRSIVAQEKGGDDQIADKPIETPVPSDFKHKHEATPGKFEGVYCPVEDFLPETNSFVKSESW